GGGRVRDEFSSGGGGGFRVGVVFEFVDRDLARSNALCEVRWVGAHVGGLVASVLTFVFAVRNAFAHALHPAGMTAADLVLTNAEIHTLADPDETAEALAVRDGEIVRVDSNYEIGFLEGVETHSIDLDGRTVLPGFIDAHTHMTEVGTRLVHADLSVAESPDEAIELLVDRADETADEWVLGYGYDESNWAESRYLDRNDLDSVSVDRPVVAFREDMHTAGVNSVVLDRLGDRMPDGDVEYENGDPTGVIV